MDQISTEPDARLVTDPAPGAISVAGQVALATVVGLVAVVLWAPSTRLDLWLDEVITIAIAEHSFSEIIEILRLDGSPPLYYLLAGVWQSIFGTSEIAARALPLTIGVLAVALGSVGVARRIDARTGWIFGALAVMTPSVLYYSTEARQYSLMFALGLMTSLLLFDEITAQRRRQRVLLALVLAAACYTHNWGLFLTAGTLVALVVCDDRPLKARIVSAAPVAAIVAVLYLPWLTVVLHQASTTGAPWLAAPTDLEIVLHDLGRVFGNTTIGLFLIGVAVIGRFAVRQRTYDGLFVQAAATVALGWIFSVMVAPAFTYKYLMIAVPAVLIMLAIAASHDRKLGVSVVAIGLLMTVFTATQVIDRPSDYKSRAVEVAGRIDSHRRTGATVAIVAADTSLPALSYYLDDELDAPVRFVSFSGLLDDPQIVDWSDVTEAMRSWSLDDSLQPILDEVDVVIFLEEHQSVPPNRMTEYWVEREAALQRAAAVLRSEPRLDLTDEWTSRDWVAQVYEVVR